MANYWTRFDNHRLRRRRFLAGSGIALAGGTTALMLGCGGNNKVASPKASTSASSRAGAAGSPAAASGGGQAVSQSATAAAQVKTGGTLKGPNAAAPDIFDPAITLHSGSFLEGTTTCLAGLLTYDEQINIVAHMADVPQQPDPLTYVFKLKPGIKWHNLPPANGRAFTADDAVFGLQRFTHHNPEFIYGASLAPIDKYEVVDPQTFKLTLKAPHAPLLLAIADDSCMMVNREMVDQLGDAGIKKYENLLGTGPWIRGELKQNVSSYLVKNPEYFIKGQPYLDRLEFIIMTDPVARWAAFRSKQVDTSDVRGASVSKEESDQIKSELGDKVVSQAKRSIAYVPICLNTEREPFTDPRVRRAFHLAIDRQAHESAAGKGNVAFMAAIPQSLPAYAIPDMELLALPGYRQPKDQDIADAKKLLAAAGVTGTLKVACTTAAIGTPFTYHTVAAQAALKKIDVELDLQVGGGSDILANRAKSNFVMLVTATTGVPDPDPLLYNQFHSQGTSNYDKYKSANFDKLAEAQRQELDTAKRKQIVRDAQNLLLEDVPMIFITSNIYYPTAWSYVKGWRITPGFNQGWVTAGIWLDKT